MSDKISIVNYFDKGLSWDIFVQGFIVTIVLVASLLYLLYLLPYFRKKNQSLIDFYLQIFRNRIIRFFSENSFEKSNRGNELISKVTRLFQFISLTGVIIVISFMLGVVFSNVSDSFMDQHNLLHFGLKKNWTNVNDSCGLMHTDEGLKIKTFDNIFGASSLKPSSIKETLKKLKKPLLRNNTGEVNKNTRSDVIKEIYYLSKHQILESNKWAEYLSYTQTLINLNQTFCFSMWILMAVAFLGFLITLGMSIKLRKSPDNNHTNFELIFLSIMALAAIANVFLPVKYSVISIIALVLFVVLSVVFMQLRLIHGHRLSTSITLTIISVLLYHITAIAWVTCEIESCAKTYGLFVHLDKELSKHTIDLFREFIFSN